MVSNQTAVNNVSNAPPQGGSHVVVVHITISPLFYIDILILLANIVLLILLLSIYLENYKKIKSVFTLGLIMFAVLLLLQNLVFSSFLIFGPIFQIAELGLPIFAFSITEFLALFILLVITWRS